MNPYIPAIRDEMARLGITDYEFRRGGKHLRVVWTRDGQSRFYVFPSSPSDGQRGMQNMLAGLRREIGVAAPERAKSVRPKKRRARDVLAVPDEFTVRPDPLLVLLAWKPAPPPSRFLWVRTRGTTWRVEVLRD